MFGFIRRKKVYDKIDELIDRLDERLVDALYIKATTEEEKAEKLEAIHKLNGSIGYLRLLRSKI